MFDFVIRCPIIRRQIFINEILQSESCYIGFFQSHSFCKNLDLFLVLLRHSNCKLHHLDLLMQAFGRISIKSAKADFIQRPFGALAKSFVVFLIANVKFPFFCISRRKTRIPIGQCGGGRYCQARGSPKARSPLGLKDQGGSTIPSFHYSGLWILTSDL
jgi:hypothetical protein